MKSALVGPRTEQMDLEQLMLFTSQEPCLCISLAGLLNGDVVSCVVCLAKLAGKIDQGFNVALLTLVC